MNAYSISQFFCLHFVPLQNNVLPIRRVANALASGNSEFNYVYRASVFGRPLRFSNKSDKHSRMEWTNKISVKMEMLSKRQ